MEVPKAPVLFRGVERLLIVLGAVLTIVLGYWLFRGAAESEATLLIESELLRVVLSGRAPGLFFMVSGVFVLVVAVFTRAKIARSQEGGGERGGGLRKRVEILLERPPINPDL